MQNIYSEAECLITNIAMWIFIHSFIFIQSFKKIFFLPTFPLFSAQASKSFESFFFLPIALLYYQTKTEINTEHHKGGLVLYKAGYADTKAPCKRRRHLKGRLKVKTKNENTESEQKKM